MDILGDEQLDYKRDNATIRLHFTLAKKQTHSNIFIQEIRLEVFMCLLNPNPDL